jgi:hypothetical protein
LIYEQITNDRSDEALIVRAGAQSIVYVNGKNIGETTVSQVRNTPSWPRTWANFSLF